MGVFCRDKGSHLGQDRNQSNLADEGRLARHIGACDQVEALIFSVEKDVIGDVGLRS